MEIIILIQSASALSSHFKLMAFSFFFFFLVSLRVFNEDSKIVKKLYPFFPVDSMNKSFRNRVE